jgi:4a-hydroxytetrahydrobiopterin dehydratase
MAESKVGNLAAKHCVPCHGGVPALHGEELAPYAAQLPTWKIVREHHIAKTFVFPDFKKALKFANRIGAVAEEEGHHPDLCVSWGKLDVQVFTHKVKGLTESDFILAAKIDGLFESK